MLTPAPMTPPDETDSTDEPRASASESGFAIGNSIAHYTLDAPLGAGAFGYVFRCFDSKLQQQVALKILPAVEDADDRAKLRREALALAKLSHPNIVPIYDAGEVNNAFYIAMQYIESGTLREWILRTPRSTSEVVERFTEIARGLAHIHDAGFIHRDIKPDNILVPSQPERALIADLGLTGQAQDTHEPLHSESLAKGSWQRSLSGKLVGTPGYLAPEVRAGGASSVRSDQYAFGCSLKEVLGAQRKGTELSNLPRSVPRSLRRVCARLCSDNPADRFPSMQKVAAALQLAIRPLWQQGRFLALAGAAALVAFALGGFALMRARTADTHPACSRMEASIDKLWQGNNKSRVQAALAGLTGAEESSIAAIQDTLASQRHVWRDASSALCRSAAKEAATSSVRMICYERQLVRLLGFQEIAAGLTSTTLKKAVSLAKDLPAPAACDAASPLDYPAPAPEKAARFAELLGELDAVRDNAELGNYAEARQQMDMLRAQVDAFDNDVVRTDAMVAEAGLLVHENRLEEAYSMYRDVLVLAERAENDERRAAALASLVGDLNNTVEEAESYAERARQVIARIGHNPLLEFKVAYLLTSIYMRFQLRDKARASALLSKDILERAGNSDPQRLGEVYGDLSMLLDDINERLSAGTMAIGYDRQRGKAGREHLAISLTFHGEALRAAGRAQEAMGFFEEALEVERDLHGADYFNMAQHHLSLCLAQTEVAFESEPRDKSLFAEAEGHCKKAIDIYDKNTGDGPDPHGGRLHMTGALARVYSASGSYDKAIAMYEDILAKADAIYPLSLLDKASIQVALAEILSENELGRALGLLTEARDVYKKELTRESHSIDIDAKIREVKAKLERKKKARGGVKAKSPH